MNINQYEREAQKFHNYVMQFHNFVDRIRGVIELSSYEEQLGRMTKDTLDQVKRILFSLEKKVRDYQITPGLVVQTENNFSRIKEDFGFDNSINNMLDQIYNSLSWLRIHQEDVDDDDEGVED